MALFSSGIAGVVCSLCVFFTAIFWAGYASLTSLTFCVSIGFLFGLFFHERRERKNAEKSYDDLRHLFHFAEDGTIQDLIFDALRLRAEKVQKLIGLVSFLECVGYEGMTTTFLLDPVLTSCRRESFSSLWSDLREMLKEEKARFFLLYDSIERSVRLHQLDSISLRSRSVDDYAPRVPYKQYK